jgi:hypothetical protein
MSNRLLFNPPIQQKLGSCSQHINLGCWNIGDSKSLDEEPKINKKFEVLTSLVIIITQQCVIVSFHGKITHGKKNKHISAQ